MSPLSRAAPFCAVLAAALLAPAAAADVPGLPPSVGTGDAIGAETSIESVVLAKVARYVELSFASNTPVKYEARITEFTIECRTTQSGARECNGMICWSSSGKGDLPVSPGRRDEGIGIGTDDDLKEDSDGDYGPYEGVYISIGANCGCTGGGVNFRWVDA